MASIMASEVAAVWRERGMPDTLRPELTQLYADVFYKALENGYGVDFSQIDYTTPDGEVIRQLQTNVYQFSAAKNYSQLLALSRALVDDAGRIRSWSDFKKAAFAINNNHVNQWLEAEYNLALNSAQMAAKWREITSDGQRKLLEFDAVLDQGTTALCRSLDQVRKWSDDPFWNVYYPPNHFGCRSLVKILNDGTATPEFQVELPELQPMFQTNMAKTGVLFPPSHPYWIGVPADELERAAQMARR